MANDGHVIIGTELDESGLRSGLSGLGSMAKKGFAVVGEAAASAAKMATAAVGAATAAVSALTVSAVKSYSEYEQLVGGIETLFGARGAKTIQEYADSVGKTVGEVRDEYEILMEAQDLAMENAANAYATAGMSANEYMSTVTSFAASLKQSTENELEAAEAANNAVIDMADNANKMGTSMESIQNAYQGFAKQNYTMLDNLKLGYGGTKEEMERLLADAEKLSGVKYDIGNLNDVYSAIHVIQAELGITGTTAKEASTTIEGSINSAKAAWANLVTGLADDNQDLSELVNNFVDSALTAADNVLPRVEIVLGGIGSLVEKALPVIANKIPGIINDVLPGLVKSGTDIVVALMGGIGKQFPQLVSTAGSVLSSLAGGLISMLPELADVGKQVLQMLYNGIITGIPLLFQTAADIINNLAAGLDSSIPILISKALDLIQNFATTLAVNAPILIQAGLNLITNLAQGIINAIPTMIEKIPTIISTFANIINDNAPMVLQAGIGILVSLVEGIISAIPTLVANIPKIIQAIVDVWSAFNWINLGKNAINFLKDGIMGMIGAVQSAAMSVQNGITNIIQQLPSKLLQFGRNGVSGLAGALRSGITSVVSQAKNILTGIINVFKPDSLLNVGKNLIKGLWNGISSMAGWILDKIGGFCDSIVGGIKDFFGIHSPSTVMRDIIGKNMIAGIGVGMEEETPKLERISVNSAQRAVAGMQSAVFNRSNAVTSQMVSPMTSGVSSQDKNMSVMLQKGSITGTVIMDGTKVGELVAPIVDMEIEQSRKESTR